MTLFYRLVENPIFPLVLNYCCAGHRERWRASHPLETTESLFTSLSIVIILSIVSYNTILVCVVRVVRPLPLRRGQAISAEVILLREPGGWPVIRARALGSLGKEREDFVQAGLVTQSRSAVKLSRWCIEAGKTV